MIIKKPTYFVKASEAIAIATVVLLSAVAVYAEDQPSIQGDSLTGMSDYQVIAENSSAYPGTIGHVVNISGVYSEEIFAYVLNIIWLSQEENDTTVTDINLDGCVGENPFYFNWNVQTDPTGYVIVTATVVYTIDWTPGHGIPAGAGKLLNIVVGIAGNATPQVIPISKSPLSQCTFSTLAGTVYPEFIDGILEILRVPNPPEAPDQPTGPTSGIVGVDYTYTTHPVTGGGVGHKYYKWNFTDSETNWLTYGPGADPQATHNWSNPGIYQVKVKAKNMYDDEGPWSEPLTVVVTHQVKPQLSIEVTGGIGLNVNVMNTGNGDATNVRVNGTIEGGFFVTPRNFSKPITTLGSNQSYVFHVSTFGVGLGVIKPLPEITVGAVCDQEVSAEKVLPVKILLFLVLHP